MFWSFLFLFLFLCLPLGIYIMKIFSGSLWGFSFFFSFMSSVSFMMLMIIFIFLMYFSFYYMESYKYIIYYWALMSLFAGSMIMLLISNSLFTFIVGWDGLGVTSYLLVCYYSSWSSFNGALVTVLSNKLGDVFLMWFFSLVMFSSFPFLICSYYFVFLFLAAITKSAQFPFSSWLPQAMAAPTPTSGLVHSSTLVTGGIYLILKFYPVFYSFKSMVLMFYVGWVTLFLSGFLALIEMDTKKVVALSTLNQLGFMFLSLSLGNLMFVLFHLISHAFFKSCLFVPVGFFISSSSGNQDFRLSSSNFMMNPFYFVILVVSIFSLMGVCFLSGFYSKELILLTMMVSNFWLILAPLSILFTILYSVKLIYMSICMGLASVVFKTNSLFSVMSSSVLFFLSCFWGNFFSNNFSMVGILMSFFETKLVFIMFFFVLFLSLFYFSKFSNMLFLDNFYKSFKVLNFELLYQEFWVSFILMKFWGLSFNKLSQVYSGVILFSVFLVFLFMC